MRLGIGLGLFKQAAVSVGVRLFSAYKSRVIADGGTVEADNCVINALNNGLFQRASLLIIPSGYKGGKAYAEIPTNGNGDLTWTRASTALRTNSSGLLESMGSGVPRLSYMYGSCPALLLEPQRTNLIRQSQAFDDNAYWGAGSTTITANDEISPDGTTNAESMTIIDSTSQVLQTLVLGAGTYTASVWVKSLSGTPTIRLRLIVDTVVASQNINTTSSWQRVTFTFTATTSVTSFGVRGLTGSGEIAIFGAQLELGAYPTTYIPTTTASATRIADSFSRNNIYTNGLITSSGGTWFVELRGNLSLVRDLSSISFFIGDTNVGTTNGFNISSVGGGGRLRISKYTATTFSQLYLTTTDTVKLAIKWNGTSADVFVNGTKQVSATAFTTTIMEFLIGGASDVPKFIQAMALYPTPLSDTDCTTLTTL
jgi:hypothetical protein